MHEILANIAGSGLATIRLASGAVESVQVLRGEDTDLTCLAPGFVDLQLNGFAGVDFSDPCLEPEQAASVLRAVWATGTTSFCPTLITNSRERLIRNFSVLEAARNLDRRFAASVPCYHLEGPYLCRGEARGVHGSQYLRPPDWDEFVELQEAAGGNIGLVTLAPELPGAIEFIERCTRANIVAAIGHTEANAEQIRAAVDAGARLSTHLGNGCAPVLDRHRNPLWPQLAEDRLSASLVCDTFHLPPEFVQVVVKSKGVDGCILVTDASHVAGLPPGRYTLVDAIVELLPSGKVVKVDGWCLAGSAVSMGRAVAVFMRDGGVSLAGALKAASTNPARLIGKAGVCTDVRPGAPANLVEFRPRAESLDIQRVWLAGEVVYEAGRPERTAGQ